MISVIVPVYNKVKYVADILGDLQQQTFADFECVVMDDGSSDGSGTVCDRIADADKRFRVIHIANEGVSHARNVALDIATGEYITFVDADDRIAPEYLQNLYSCITDSGADFVISNFCRSFSNGEQIEAADLPCNGVIYMTELLPDFIKIQKSSGIYGFCCGKMFRRELATDIRFDETIALAEDFDFYLKIYRHVRNIYFDNHKLYYYLQEADNSPWLRPDNETDYFAQLKINLKLKVFLSEYEQYNGENRRILDETIAGYVYCCLFYIDMRQFNERFIELKKILQDNEFTLKSERLLIRMFNLNLPLLIKLYLKTYRKMRALLK